MNLSFSFPSNFRENLLRANLDFASDAFKMLLMRPGFVFNSSNHLALINLITTTGAITYYFTLATSTFTRTDAGSFITDGFVVGNYITTNGANNGVYVVLSVTASAMRVRYVSGTALANEGTVGVPVTFTIVSNDEMPTGSGYTSGAGGEDVSFSLSGDDLLFDTVKASPAFTFDWGVFGTALLTAPGCVIYDFTQADNPVVAYARLSPWTVAF